MGYVTSVTGGITITPPITWGELREAEQTMDTRRPGTIDYGQVRLVVAEREVETAEGLLTVREGTRLVPWSDDGYRADPEEMQQVLRGLVGAFVQSPDQAAVLSNPAFREWAGYLQGDGEEQGDLWRCWIDATGVHLARARLVWAEGTPGPA